MDLLGKAHEYTKTTQEEILKLLLEKYPELSKEYEYNIRKYGYPVLGSEQGGLWKEELAEKVQDLLYKEFSHELIEINIRPEDPDCLRWSCDYNILTEVSGILLRAIDVERGKYVALNKKVLYYLTHDKKEIFSGYGMPLFVAFIVSNVLESTKLIYNIQ